MPRAAGAGAANRPALAALVVGAVGIGFAPILVRLSETGPSATAFWRIVLALPLLIGWMSWERRRAVGERVSAPASPRRSGPHLGWLIIPGLCFAADLAVWHWSLRATTIANGTLLPNLAPIFVTLFSWLLFGQRFRRTFLAGLAVAVTGVALLLGDSRGLGLDHLAGDGLALLTAVFYAGYILAVGRLRSAFSTATIMTVSGVVSAAALAGCALAADEVLLPVSGRGWLALVGLGWISHAGGQSLIAYALAHLPAAFSSVTLLIQPAVAAVLAWLLFGEGLGPTQALGALVVLAGIMLARRGSR